MVRRKGKSQRRVRNWQQRYHAGQDVEEAALHGSKLSHRAVKLREEAFAASDEEACGMDRKEGMVVGLFRRGTFVRVEGKRLFCGIAKTFRAPEDSSPLAVGDVVTVAMSPADYTSGQKDIDKDRMDGMIISRHRRDTVLLRPEPRSGKRRDEYGRDTFHKVIAANMDLLLIVAATRKPALRRGLIDRFLIIAQRGELQPVLVVNKIDLASPDESVIAEFRDLGMEVLACSAKTNEGMDALASRLANHRSILAGASGVGKSTLINALIPDAHVVTRSIREKDDRGRHTTSASVIYDLPGGGIVVDTPGIRELGIRLDAAQLPWYFPEFEENSHQCRFNDCTHTHEPGCAVVVAVQEGLINPRRYDSYLRIMETMSENRA